VWKSRNINKQVDRLFLESTFFGLPRNTCLPKVTRFDLRWRLAGLVFESVLVLDRLNSLTSINVPIHQTISEIYPSVPLGAAVEESHLTKFR